MNIIKRIFCALFAVYALLAFAVMLLIAALAYVLVFNVFSKAKAPRIAHRVSQLWAQMVFVSFFTRVKIIGRELIDPQKTYVFVANHSSQLDIPLYALACRNTFRFLAKAELTKIPLLGYIIKNLYITVDRQSRLDRSRATEVMMQSLRNGISVFICPEGTRNRTNAPLLEFRDGAFRLAIESQTPLAVLTVLDMKRINSAKDPFMLCPGVVHAVWSAPIETKGMTQDDMPALKAKARQLMLENLESFNKNRK